MKYVVALVCVPQVLGLVAWAVLADPPRPSTAPDDARQVRELVATDSSGHDRHGILEGGVVQGLPGHDGGRSYSFASRDAWVQVPSVPALNPRRRDFLVSAWVVLQDDPDPGETYDLVRKGLGFTIPGEFKLEVLDGGRVRCSAKDEAGRLAVVTDQDADVADGAWHRIGCARVGGEWGVVVDEETMTRRLRLGSVRNTVSLSIGSKYGFEDRPDGRVDEVRFAARRPDADAPHDFAAALQELETMAPAGWWHLDEPAAAGAGR